MHFLSVVTVLLAPFTYVNSFSSQTFLTRTYDFRHRCDTEIFAGHPSSAVEKEAPTGFIDVELRGAAMKLHTRSQAREGEAEEEEREPHITTMDDYLLFLVDSQHVYKAFEEIISLPELQPELEPFIETGLERTEALETDINFIISEYGITRPSVGQFGEQYSKELWEVASKKKAGIPEFICHYYNHYFAHTAGGRMIGKQMAALLLGKKVLEFYKWDNLNEIKSKVKDSIEETAASWSKEEKDQCVQTTAAAFQGGGMLNSYLGGNR